MAGSTYPHDPTDRRLKECQECSDRWMPDAFCPKHKHRCLTCCERLQANCGLRATSQVTQELGESMEAVVDMTKDYRAQVQADIDALYGPGGDR